MLWLGCRWIMFSRRCQVISSQYQFYQSFHFSHKHGWRRIIFSSMKSKISGFVAAAGDLLLLKKYLIFATTFTAGEVWSFWRNLSFLSSETRLMMSRHLVRKIQFSRHKEIYRHLVRKCPVSSSPTQLRGSVSFCLLMSRLQILKQPSHLYLWL